MADFHLLPKIEVKLPENIPAYVWERVPVFVFLIFAFAAPTTALQLSKKFFEENKIIPMVVAIGIVQLMVVFLFFVLTAFFIYRGYF